MPTEPLRRRRPLGPGTDPGFAALKAKVIARTGHHYYADKDDLLFDRLVKRFRALGLPDASSYARHLDGPRGDAEWQALEGEITIGETFFFRYAEQFAALRGTILPDLIGARAQEKCLRIWSAGCATGAEPYSIAILLHDLLGPALADWSITILGTDINAAALDVARQAEYGRWALRTLQPAEHQRWFRQTAPRPGPTREGGFRLRSEFRTMVRFERQNLIGLIDGTIPPSFCNFDLILCRNVLIYFSSEAVFGIVRGFGERLRADAWLLIGHAEPNPAFAGWLTPVNLPGTIAYRRLEEPAAALVPDPVQAPASVPVSGIEPFGSVPAPETPVRPSERAWDGFAAGTVPPDAKPSPRAPLVRPNEAAAPPEIPPAAEPALPRIRALADAGDTAQAWRALREALDTNPTDASLRFYEGLLALGLGREAEAERALRGAVFLDRDFVMAHYHLGLLLIALGRHPAARRALDNAHRLAQGLPPTAPLPEGDGVTAGEMVGNARVALDSVRSLAR